MTLCEHKTDGVTSFSVAVAVCMVQFTVFGVLNSFTVFARDMSSDSSLGNPTQTELSFGNSVGMGLAPIFGAVAGGLSDRFGPRVMCVVSCFSLFAGLWLSSLFAHGIIPLIILFSVLSAVATGFMLSPGAAACSSWFVKFRSLGTGIAFSGGGLGSCVVPVVAGGLVGPFGWRKSFQILSPVCGVGLFAALLVRSLKPHSLDDCDGLVSHEDSHDTDFRRRLLTPRELMKEVILTTNFAAHFFSFLSFCWTFYSLLYILVPYASSMGKSGTVYANEVEITTESASTLMTSYGVFQILGSLSIGLISDRIGNKPAHAVCCVLGVVSLLGLVFCRTYAQFAVGFSAIGFATAGVMALVPAMIGCEFAGPNVGHIIGWTFFASVVGGFSGPPIQAALQQEFEGNYGIGVGMMALLNAVSGIICAVWISEAANRPS